MKLVYGVSDKPSWGKTMVFALQQLLAIMAATIVVPVIVNSNVGGVLNLQPLSQTAALFGAGVGTLVYLLFTKFKSPVFLGSSFAFLSSMAAAFGGAVSASAGYLGLIIGAVLAGLVYVIIALVVKKFGTKWIDKLMPAVVIGPVVAIIGLSLAGSAVSDVFKGGYTVGGVPSAHTLIACLCGLVTLFVTIGCSIYGKKTLKMIPFIIGILAGYAVAALFTAFSYIGDGNLELRVINFELFSQADWSKWYPDFTFLTAFSGNYDWGSMGNFGAFFGTIALAYIPVALVVFAEHIADHKNLSTIIESDLLTEPGLHRTLLGDGVGSMAGAFFGGAPNTTYGESVGCVAISGNASIRTITVTAFMAIALSFILPFSLFLRTIPNCVMGGVCMTLYGFIAVSGLKMIQKVDLGDNKNLFVVSVILIAGVGGFSISLFQGKVLITTVACALILGILVNIFVNLKFNKVVATIGPKKDNEEKKDNDKEEK